VDRNKVGRPTGGNIFEVHNELTCFLHIFTCYYVKVRNYYEVKKVYISSYLFTLTC